MAKKGLTRSSKRPLFIAILITMLLSTVVFAFVGCNTRNKKEEPETEQMEEYPEEEDPPIDEEEEKEDEDEKEQEQEEDKKTEKEKAPEKPVTPPVVTSPPANVPASKPAPKPSKPVTPAATSKTKYGSITITKNGRYSERKTYNNVTVKADSVRLMNKTIKGDLIIDDSVDDNSVITLDNVIVKGDIIIDGGYKFNLYNVDADKINVTKSSGKVRLTAFEKTEIEDVRTVRSIYLKEDDLDRGYDGFKNLTTASSRNIYINVDLYNCDLDGLYCNEITKIKALDDCVDIDEVKAYDRVDIGSGVDVDKFTVYESGCTYVIEPDRIYTKNGAHEPDKYERKSRSSSHSSSSNTPTVTTPVVSLVYDNNAHTITSSWLAVTNSVKYRLSYSTDSGTTWTSPTDLTATNYQLGGITSKDTFKIRVTAVDSSGKESSAGGTSSVIAEKLETPANVAVTINNNIPTISWDKVTNATKYEIEYYVNETKTTTTSTGTSLTLPACTDTTTITATVKALGNGSTYTDSGTKTSPQTTITKLDTPTSAPTINTSNDGTSITATIKNIPSDNRIVEYSTDNGKKYSTYSDSFKVFDGNIILARVKTIGNGSTTLDSNYATSASTTITKLNAPSAPKISIGGDGTVTITHENALDGVTYAVYYDVFNTIPTNPTATNLYSASIPALTNGQTICAKVIATSKLATKLSNESEVKSLDIAQLDKPTVSQSGNVLTWDNVANATSYDVTVNKTTHVDPPVTVGKDTSSVDLSSYVGQEIDVDVVAKGTNVLNSEAGKWSNSGNQLPTPTPTGTGTSYNISNDNKLILAFINALDTSNADYDIAVAEKNDSSKTMKVTVTDINSTTTPNTITATVTTAELATLPTGDYTVTVTAKAKDISQIDSLPSDPTSFTVPTPPKS